MSMKIRVENLGALQQAEFTLGDLTILCGGNNTGKTYATYALHGFLSFWREVISIPIHKNIIPMLREHGAVRMDIAAYKESAASFLDQGCGAYAKRLPMIFAATEERFGESVFRVEIDPSRLDISRQYERVIGGAKKNSKFFSFAKAEDSTDLTITLLTEKNTFEIPPWDIARMIENALKDILFGPVFPEPFIASAERTGAAIFRKDLNFARNRILEEIGQAGKDIDPMALLSRVHKDYAWPVKENVDFTRRLEEISKGISFLSADHPDLLADFAEIIGGEYAVTQRDQLYFQPKGRRRLKLSMDESSSAVRSLLDVGFYLKHLAKPGDILMIDEPELNLHPENQRRVARLFARLVNFGIKVFVTTHSDYLVKELNTLIMLNHDKPHLKRIAEQEGYRSDELLSPDQVRVYVAGETLLLQEGKSRRTRGMTLTPAAIDPELGIEVGSFDSTIDTMNRIQEEIVWGGE